MLYSTYIKIFLLYSELAQKSSAHCSRFSLSQSSLWICRSIRWFRRGCVIVVRRYVLTLRRAENDR